MAAWPSTTPASHAYISGVVARQKPSKSAEHRWQISLIKAKVPRQRLCARRGQGNRSGGPWI